MTKNIEGTFQIHIFGSHGHYLLSVIGPKQIKVENQPFDLRFTSDQLLNLDTLRKRPRSLNIENIIDLGRVMYAAVFTPPVERAFGVLENMYPGDTGARIRLVIDPTELASLPWELMHDGNDFIALRSSFPIVRGVSTSIDSQQISIKGALKILYVWAAPDDIPKIEPWKSADTIKRLLAGNKRIQFDILPGATLTKLQSALLQDYHIVCFACHGTSEYISLENDKKLENKVSPQTLNRMFEKKGATRLIFLASCQTGYIKSPDDLGFARNLMFANDLPAVIAMQYDTGDEAANLLTARYFEAVATFRPVDAALSESRKIIADQKDKLRDVFAPVLYLQSKSSNLFSKARNWLAISLAVVLLVVVMIALSLNSLAQNRKSEAIQAGYTAQTEAAAREISDSVAQSRAFASRATSILDTIPDVATLISIEAINRSETYEAKESLMSSLLAYPYATTYLRGHEDNIFAVKFSADGTLIATGGQDLFKLNIWDVSSANPRLKSISIDIAPINVENLAFSPDNSTLAIAGCYDLRMPECYQSWLYIADVRTNKIIQKLVVPEDMDGYAVGDFWNSYILAYSSDSRFLAAGGCLDDICQEGFIKIWDVKTGQLYLSRPTDFATRGLNFSPDGRKLAISRWERSIQILDISSNTIKDLPISGDGIVMFSPDSQSIAYSSEGRVILYSFLSGQVLTIPTQYPEEDITDIHFTEDGLSIFVAYENDILVYDLTNGQKKQEYTDLKNVKSIYVGKDNEILAAGSLDELLVMWDLKTPGGWDLIGNNQSKVVGLWIDENKNGVISVTEDGSIFYWDISTHKKESRIDNPFNEQIISADFSRDGRVLALLTQSHNVILDLESGSILCQTQKEGIYYVENIALSDDGKVFALNLPQERAELWDVNLCKRISTFEDIGGYLSLSADGSLLVGSHERFGSSSYVSYALWDTRQEEEINSSEIFDVDRTMGIEISPRGDILALGVGDRFEVNDGVQILSTSDGEVLQTLQFSEPCPTYSLGIKFNPTGDLLATSCGSRLLLYDMDNFKKLGGDFSGTGEIHAIAFSDDGLLLAAGYKNGDVFVANLDSSNMIKKACQMINRNLTEEEWNRYFKNIPYEATCKTLSGN